MTARVPARRTTAVAVGLAALLPALLHLPVLLGSEVFASGEILYMHYPSLHYVFEMLGRSGQFPQWAPGAAAGIPLAGNIEFSLFYPLNWLLYPLGDALYLGLNWLTVAHLALASSLTALLARRWGASAPAAVVAGGLYSLNGFMADHTTQLMTLETTAWLPLLLLLTDRLVAERRLRWMAAAGACGGLALLGGMTQYGVCLGLVCGSYGLLRCLAERRALGRAVLLHRLALLGGAAALASGLFCAQLLPTLELLEHSGRLAMSYKDALGPPNESLYAEELVGLFAPSALGGRARQDAATGAYYNLYAGMVGVGLALLAIAARRPRSRFLLSLLLLGLGLALGRHLPLFSLLYHSGLPGVWLLKDPNRYVYLIYLPLALLAAQGLDALVAGGAAPGFWRARTTRVLITAWGLLWLAGLTTVIYYHQGRGAAPAAGPAVFELVLCAALPLTALLAVRGLAGTRRWLRPGRLVCGLVLLELFLLCPPSDEIMSANDFERLLTLDGALPELERRLPPDRRFHSDLPGLTWNLALAHGLYGAPAKGALLPRRHITLTGLGRAPGPRDHFPFHDYLKNPAVSRLLGVCCEVVSGPRPTWLGQQFRFEEAIGALSLYRQDGALGPMRLSAAVHGAASAEEALRAVLAPTYDPDAVAVVEGVADRAARGAPGSLQWRREPPNAYSARVALDAPAVLVLHQSYHPGWRVRVDGAEAELLRADYAFQAVRLPPGEHTVRFTFASPALEDGLVLAGLSLLCILVLAALPRRQPAR